MFSEKLYLYDTLDKATNGMSSSGLSYSPAETPSDNQWTFNSNKEIHIKDSSTSLTGVLSERVYGLVVGDIIEIDCEVFSISGVLPKIAIDSNVKVGILNTDGYSYPQNVWKRMSVKYVVQENAEYHSIKIGTFTLDVSDFKIRNVRIKVLSQTSVFSELSTINFPLASGLEPFNSTNFPCIITRSGNLVTLTVYFKKTDGSPITANSTVIVGTIPTQYRPKSGFAFPIVGTPDDENGGGRGWVYESGVLDVRPYVEMRDIAISITYISN